MRRAERPSRTDQIDLALKGLRKLRREAQTPEELGRILAKQQELRGTKRDWQEGNLVRPRDVGVEIFPARRDRDLVKQLELIDKRIQEEKDPTKREEFRGKKDKLQMEKDDRDGKPKPPKDDPKPPKDDPKPPQGQGGRGRSGARRS